ncbi:hypothetical protein GYMLUDRAFT_704564 [Collybiopsis luxurians FD-317 M1]|uniref:Uncharacterized protein n=1 Tax=Collybiopsis luxurians FD-317 M1 TaxID=944289 RepID=A0A0D0BS04_9AGAR|nr:hypothetical protein GYMLUDRAFT_704564 [Collybiopsis luxurians FD-317 M1]
MFLARGFIAAFTLPFPPEAPAPAPVPAQDPSPPCSLSAHISLWQIQKQNCPRPYRRCWKVRLPV